MKSDGSALSPKLTFHPTSLDHPTIPSFGQMSLFRNIKGPHPASSQRGFWYHGCKYTTAHIALSTLEQVYTDVIDSSVPHRFTRSQTSKSLYNYLAPRRKGKQNKTKMLFMTWYDSNLLLYKNGLSSNPVQFLETDQRCFWMNWNPQPLPLSMRLAILTDCTQLALES